MKVKFCFACRNNSVRNSDKMFFRYPEKSNFQLCTDHIPANCIGKRKLKVSCYKKIEEILKTENIDVPSVSVVKAVKMKYSSKKCIMDHCGLTNLSRPVVTFFEFPRNSVLRQQWIDICHLSHRSNLPVCKYLCEKHFDNTCFVNTRLKKTAIPNLCLPPNTVAAGFGGKNGLSFSDEMVLGDESIIRYFFF